MKKKLVAMMMATLCLALTACQGGEASKSDSASAATASSKTEASDSSGEKSSSVESVGSSANASTVVAMETTAARRMLADLLVHVSSCEKFYGGLLAVFDSFSAFDEARTWESLLTARGAVDLTDAKLAACTFPEPQMTEDDQMELMEKGLDASFLEYAEQTFEKEQEGAKINLGDLKFAGSEGSLLNEDWAPAIQRVAILKKLYEAKLKYRALSVEWTLASLQDSELEEEFREAMEESCPLTLALLPETLRSTEEIEAIIEETIQVMEEAITEQAENNGVYTDREEARKALIEAEDYEAIGEDVLAIEGKPMTLPYPAGVTYQNITYLWTKDDKPDSSATYIEFENAPNACKIEAANVTRQAVEEYLEVLENAGLANVDDGAVSSFSDASSEETENAAAASDASSEETENAAAASDISVGETGKLSRSYRYEDGLLAVEYTDDGTGKGTLVLSMEQTPLFFADTWYVAEENAVG